jgi:hypothetical protein
MLTTVDQPLVLRQQDIAIALGMPLPGPAAGYAERISVVFAVIIFFNYAGKPYGIPNSTSLW